MFCSDNLRFHQNQIKFIDRHNISTKRIESVHWKVATITTAAATNTAAAAVAQTLNKSQSRIAKFLPAIKLSKVNHLRSARVFRYISIFIFVPISNLVGLFVQFCLQLIYTCCQPSQAFSCRDFCVLINDMYSDCVRQTSTIPFQRTNASNAGNALWYYGQCHRYWILIGIQYWIFAQFNR